MRYVLPAVLTLMLLDTIAAAQEVSTGFEEFFPNTPLGEPFTIGDSPDSAEFSGDAFAGRIGVFALYRNAVRAWMVASGGTGLIQFESGAAEVEFWARPLPSADGATRRWPNRCKATYRDQNALWR